METLKGSIAYTEPRRFAARIPYGAELQRYFPHGYLPLILDPQKSEGAVIHGIFVNRPAVRAWREPVLDGDGKPTSLYAVPGWSYAISSLPGSVRYIAAGNVLDALGLATYEAHAHAILIGSKTVADEGTGEHAHVWQPYGVAAWPHVHAAVPDLAGILGRQRDYARTLDPSLPKHPANIVVTQSGEARAGNKDFLDARIFHTTHPDGEPYQAYILTSKRGAERVLERAPWARERLLVASPPGEPEKLDLVRVPYLLAEQGMKLVLHEGGATVLHEFMRAGIVPQLTLTLGRGASVLDALEPEKKHEIAKALAFWSGDGSIPREAHAAHVVCDAPDSIATVTFDTRTLYRR